MKTWLTSSVWLCTPMSFNQRWVSMSQSQAHFNECNFLSGWSATLDTSLLSSPWLVCRRCTMSTSAQTSILLSRSPLSTLIYLVLCSWLRVWVVLQGWGWMLVCKICMLMLFPRSLLLLGFYCQPEQGSRGPFQIYPGCKQNWSDPRSWMHLPGE